MRYHSTSQLGRINLDANELHFSPIFALRAWAGAVHLACILNLYQRGIGSELAVGLTTVLFILVNTR